MWLILMRLIARGLYIQRSWLIISANNVEHEHWRTLEKIRCIIQVTLLSGFPALIQSSSPLGRILGRDTQHSFEEQEVGGSIISFAEVIGRKMRQDENQLDIFGGFSH